MDEESLKERLEYLEAQRAQTMANLNAFNGAIEECRFWQEKLRSREELHARLVNQAASGDGHS